MRESLIDLDMSLPDVTADLTQNFDPSSTSFSDVESETSEATTYSNPFGLEKHVSLTQPLDQFEPASYIPGVTAMPTRPENGVSVDSFAEFPDIDSQGEHTDSHISSSRYRATSLSGSETGSVPPPQRRTQVSPQRPGDAPYTFARFPQLPLPPSERALTGVASHEEMKDEFNRMLSAMTAQLEAFRDVYSAPKYWKVSFPASHRQRDKIKYGPMAKGTMELKLDGWSMETNCLDTFLFLLLVVVAWMLESCGALLPWLRIAEALNCGVWSTVIAGQWK
jgi:hypothetical protein